MQRAILLLVVDVVTTLPCIFWLWHYVSQSISQALSVGFVLLCSAFLSKEKIMGKLERGGKEAPEAPEQPLSSFPMIFSLLDQGLDQYYIGWIERERMQIQ
jgi:hypothetical protein